VARLRINGAIPLTPHTPLIHASFISNGDLVGTIGGMELKVSKLAAHTYGKMFGHRFIIRLFIFGNLRAGICTVINMMIPCNSHPGWEVMDI
jgi:hypothetical protein